MDFFKEWMKNLLAMVIAISIPILLCLISYLLVEYLGFIGLGIITILLVSLVTTLKNRCDQEV